VKKVCAIRAHGNFSNGWNYRHNSWIRWPRGGNPPCLLVSENFQDCQAPRVCSIAASRSRASNLSSRIGPLLDTQRLGKGDPNRVTRTHQQGSSRAGVRCSRARQESPIKSHQPPSIAGTTAGITASMHEPATLMAIVQCEHSRRQLQLLLRRAAMLQVDF
jgi:hypothetical protein